MGGEKLGLHTRAVLAPHEAAAETPGSPPQQVLFARSGARGRPACSPNTSCGAALLTCTPLGNLNPHSPTRA